MSEKMQEMTMKEEAESVMTRRGCFLLLGPPTAFLYYIAYRLSDIVLTDLIVYRTCLVSPDINATDCLMLRTNSGSPEAMDLEAKVEPYASVIVMTKSLIEDVSVATGSVLGSIAGPYIYNNYVYNHCLGTAAACCGLALACTYFRIPETVENASKESIRRLFEISFVKELMTGFTTERGSFHRSVVWLAISTLTLNTMINQGELVVDFLFTRARLGWNIKHYADSIVAYFILHCIVLCGVSLLSRVSGVTDTILTTIGAVSALGYTVTKSLAWQGWHMYLALCIGIFIEVSASSLRSIISKFVSARDLGKVFSLIALLEILSSFGGAALYTLIYSHYLPPIYPSPEKLTCHIFTDITMKEKRIGNVEVSYLNTFLPR